MYSIKKMKKLGVSLLIIVLLVSQSSVFAATDLISRAEADEQYKWDLSDIYPTNEAFYEDVDSVEALLPQIEAYSGKLNTADALVELFALQDAASRKLWKAYVYSNLLMDLDQTNSDADEMTSVTSGLYSNYLSATSFIEPEILEMPDSKIENIMEDEGLADYKVYLTGLLEEKQYILSKEEEHILSLAAELSGSPKEVFDKITIADNEDVYITTPEGEDVKLTTGLYNQILENTDREYRKNAAEARFSVYAKVNNTLAAVYESQIKMNIFFSEARGFDSALEASLHSEGIPTTVYENLILAVHEHLDVLHKYYEVRKEALGYDTLYYYDAYVPLTEDYRMEIEYDEAVDMISKALAPLGTKYVSDFKSGIANQWVDVYEDENKYTGGYQWGTYDTHPYILMNYDNTLDSALTLAHEMGHALNSKYSNEAQPYSMADYPIFTAEVASTVNELLVMDYLIQNAENDEEKLYLINKQIDNIRGTVIVQVMFSEFEQRTHEMVESGEPLSPEILNTMWLELFHEYFGDAYTTLDYQKYGWSRIPHFYWNFYVYKYATSMSAAYSIVNQIKSGDEEAVQRYLTFLEAGGSDNPIEILKAAGVDMNNSEPVDSILVYFGDLVDEFEALLNAQESN